MLASPTTRTLGGAIALGAAATLLITAGPATAKVAPARCTNAALAASQGVGQAGAGSVSAVFVLTNKGSRTCVLGGYPGMAFIGQGGTVLRSTVKRGGTTLFTNPGPKVITLKKGAAASYSLGFTEPQSAKCARTTRVRITPPGSTTQLSLATAGAKAAYVCPGQPMVVSAMVAGRAGAPS